MLVNDVPILKRLVGNRRIPADEPISPRQVASRRCDCCCSPGTGSPSSTRPGSSTVTRPAIEVFHHRANRRRGPWPSNLRESRSTPASSHDSPARRKRRESSWASRGRRRSRASSTAIWTTSASVSSKAERSPTTARGNTDAAAMTPFREGRPSTTPRDVTPTRTSAFSTARRRRCSASATRSRCGTRSTWPPARTSSMPRCTTSEMPRRTCSTKTAYAVRPSA